MLMVPISLGIGTTMPLITSSIASFIKLYLLLLFFRVLLSWFPNIDWDGQPWITLRQVRGRALSALNRSCGGCLGVSIVLLSQL